MCVGRGRGHGDFDSSLLLFLDFDVELLLHFYLLKLPPEGMFHKMNT